MTSVLLIGSGGREHAIAWRLMKSRLVKKVWIAPGNGADFPVPDINEKNADDVVAFCHLVDVSLIIIGPEGPLADGFVDRIHGRIPVFGPTSASKIFSKTFMRDFGLPTARFAQFNEIKDATAFINKCDWQGIVVKADGLAAGKGVVVAETKKAAVAAAEQMLEASKIFSKTFMRDFGLPTARFAQFNEIKDATAFINKCDWQGIVVKADGLAAGKGVVVAETKKAAAAAAEQMLAVGLVFVEKYPGQFGTSSSRILLEERLYGYEISALCFTDGFTIARMPLIRDHKRLLENDKGPNTGGMGVVGPVAVPDTINQQIDSILEDTIASLRKKGIVYKGMFLENFCLVL
ncbi:unnamed protein product [Strongylus vulgaris]|uniref:ATP-grasp domain-containing protein n=1 Tax=Strongylus vulgaris TaxID=40348 RepID=A0A3P7J989_STRVU|nr:unnamed protein product [Strongylus vulgaris]